MLRSDRKPCYPHVLRVNHQIYAEAAVFLYAQNTFEIEVSGTASIHMCNSSFSVQSFPTPNPARLFQASNNPFPHGHQGNHALQDYQMQLMLLEQQNKKRLFMARQEKDNVHHIPLPQPPPSGVPLSRSGLGEFTSLSLDPNSHLHATTWHPGNLSHANIDMIRSFQINILFPNVPQPPPTGLHMQYIQQHQILQQQMAYRQQQAQMAVQQALAQQQQAQMGAQPQNLLHQQQQATVGNMLPQPPHLMGLPLPPTVSSFAIQASAPLPPNPMSYILTPPVPTPSSTSLHPPPPQRMPWASALLERLQYETCDALNQIVGRLQLLPLPILRLNLSIYIHEYEKQEPAVTTAQLFLNTFRVLRNVVCPNVDKIMWADQFWRHTEIFHSLQDALVHPTSSSGFVNRWKAELSQQSPVPDPSPVVHAYWVLHYICFDLQAHHEAATVMASSVELHTLLLHAKMARESEDMIALRDVGQKIQNIWKTYILKQRAFESRVSNKVAFMGGLLGSDDVEPLPMDSSSSLRMDYEGKGKGRADDVGHHFRNDALPIVKDEEQEEYPNMIGGMHLCN
ncbi:hypothetical protein BLS_006581 [Venturia inaequalis]|uniref:Uncharacterized protein n=1 Tax=Venturia inaequalis TaxID=5025 RepID=A0A8H3UUQ6_VENIN|nr:hypothetical protein BLS_006581 [Venturia inaequalis]KAE9976095.1 hypothetical protein EG327_008226 [Venturia inaequalis]KAE9976992.1 hypothetical protein EG328_002319 [Venturia inaequalis]RDI79457.1 hypothetical protein Vi05172_g10608 [Venturia inaequalis]